MVELIRMNAAQQVGWEGKTAQQVELADLGQQAL
jgi:hypothetical protein